jgi:hypothetical protein
MIVEVKRCEENIFGYGRNNFINNSGIKLILAGRGKIGAGLLAMTCGFVFIWRVVLVLENYYEMW